MPEKPENAAPLIMGGTNAGAQGSGSRGRGFIQRLIPAVPGAGRALCQRHGIASERKWPGGPGSSSARVSCGLRAAPGTLFLLALGAGVLIVN